MPVSRRAPAPGVEQVLAGVFGEVLGVDQVAAEESFFDLGGDSLAAMRAVAGVNATLHTELPVTALFDAPTVAALGRVVDSAG
nr:phosphopantetheine-binding protein [Mycolicibacterium parafortuitum]